MTKEYRIYLKENNTYADECDGYSAITKARIMSRVYGNISVKEKRESRWVCIAEAVDGKLVFKGRIKDYYVLPVDQYGQPDGNINTTPMTYGEYLLRRRTEYVFSSYLAALYRAQD